MPYFVFAVNTKSCEVSAAPTLDIPASGKLHFQVANDNFIAAPIAKSLAAILTWKCFNLFQVPPASHAP
jgi:hypothetical protein